MLAQYHLHARRNMKFEYSGLTDNAVVESRTQFGANAVTTQTTETFWEKLLDNIKDPIIIILLVALLVTMILWGLGYAEWYEGAGIALAVTLAALIATWSEHSNESAFQKLLAEASAIEVKTFRNGHLHQININELVVGDIILLQPGDVIPVDGVIIAGHVDVNEASLTGESEPIRKKALPPEQSEENVAEIHRLWRAALIEDGEVVMKTTAVGDKTRYGETMKEILSAEDRLSPLQEKLTVLGKYIARFGYIGSSLIFIAFMFNHIFVQSDIMAQYFAHTSTLSFSDAMSQSWTHYVQQDIGLIIDHLVTAAILAIIVIVVSVPEGLPMMIAMVLALNMRKLLQVKVLVRKLLGIETAGSLTVLFSDKTGTLTQGCLTVSTFVTGDAQPFQQLADIPEKLRDRLGFALHYNTSAILDTSNPNHIKMVGADRTEQAMLGFVMPYLLQHTELDIVDLIPFNSSRKFSATQVSGAENLTLIKGAAEVVLENCDAYLDAQGQVQPLTDKTPLNAAMQQLAQRAMRVLAVAMTDTAIGEDKILPNRLILIGVLGLRDELRHNAYESVNVAKAAGIHVVMITGDARETAQAIGKDVGLFTDQEDAKILTSSELAQLSDVQVQQILPNLYVVARAFPTDKSRLVKCAKALGWVVGMTGDGVNDAPAVKNADVGFSMGSGTEMTKESSDIVILDDNFASITKAVLYGRTLFKSIRKFLIFQLTVNVSAIMVAFLGPFLGFDLPLTMTQLLWVNVIMDTFAGLAFAGEAALSRYMLEKPIPKDAPLISKDMWSSVLLNGITVAMLSIWFLTSELAHQTFSGGHTLGSAEAQASFLTAFFAFFVFTHMFNTFNARTEGLNLFENIFQNKLFLPIIILVFVVQILMVEFGGEIMRTVGLSQQEWLYVTVFSLILIPVDLARKLLRNVLFGNPVFH
jgi:calcium-translocating P-type ATPase